MNEWFDRARKGRFYQTIDRALVASEYEDLIDPYTGAAFQKTPVATRFHSALNGAVSSAELKDDRLEAVVEAINAGCYGLTASVWTKDLDRGEEIAATLIVESAAVNRHAAFDWGVPFPLIKQSGVGVDYADYGLKGVMRLQAITRTLPA